MNRRSLLSLIGKTAGATAMYHAMAALGFAAESNFRPPDLQGAPKGTTVLVLGAGIAGLVAAYELRRAGYRVRVLEFNARAGGRAWTLRGGDSYTEIGGLTQHCAFDKGLYFNPGPWRIPYHHHGVLHYAKRLGVALEAFVHVNYNAYVHSTGAYGGKPQRYRHVQADYRGHVAELLGKAVNAHQLDAHVTLEDQDKLLESLRAWGALNKDDRYVASRASSDMRGYEIDPGGGLMPEAVPSQPLARDELLRSRLWKHISTASEYEFQSSIFQPVGGMDRIPVALYEHVKDWVQLNARVTRIDQNEQGVAVTYTPTQHANWGPRVVRADWCVCTIPLSVLSQIELQVSQPMLEAIRAVPYDASFKAGLQFKRRFWEEDEHIYGGISYTDLPIQRIGYPATGFGQPGKGVVLGAYAFGPNAFEFTAMTPQQRLHHVLQQGAQIHPQYPQEFDNGLSVGWHRVPGAQGCYGLWTDSTRERHYKNLCQIDGRIVLAGEHTSFIPAWQEGSVLSSLDAIGRLHARIKGTTTAQEVDH